MSRQLTHEEVKDGHVHDIQKSCPTVVRWSLFDLLAVVRVHLPSESEISNDVLFTVSFLFAKPSQNLFVSTLRCCLLSDDLMIFFFNQNFFVFVFVLCFYIKCGMICTVLFYFDEGRFHDITPGQWVCLSARSISYSAFLRLW